MPEKAPHLFWATGLSPGHPLSLNHDTAAEIDIDFCGSRQQSQQKNNNRIFSQNARKNEPSFLLSMRSEHGKCEAGTLGPRKALDLADSGLKSGLSRAPL